jgi:hypothetical protein
MKDNHGVISGKGHSTLVFYQSKDASDWVKSDHLLVSDLELHWKNQPVQKVLGLERPQLTFDAKGDPIALVVAIRASENDSYNVRIPLSEGSHPATSNETKQ